MFVCACTQCTSVRIFFVALSVFRAYSIDQNIEYAMFYTKRTQYSLEIHICSIFVHAISSGTVIVKLYCIHIVAVVDLLVILLQHFLNVQCYPQLADTNSSNNNDSVGQ